MLQIMSDSLERKGLSERAISIISASWRPSTKKQYGVYIKKWKAFCAKNNLNSVQAEVKDVLDFLSELFFLWTLQATVL